MGARDADRDLAEFMGVDEIAALVERHRDLYVRWSRGPEVDAGGHSRDELTGVPLPGLSASALDVEPWWGRRPVRLWVARRLYDYAHLPKRRGPGVRPWLLRGRCVGRGPDNEPLVIAERAVGWISRSALREARELVDAQQGPWGPLDRHP
ncbi:DUF6098 family protein [Embleya sp. NPDC050493]|uniref:DUF6098 family protein n=1 Tax=Embleya sp. NPDC050493 TaxID=3363989 RepID=UPI0037ACDDB9